MTTIRVPPDLATEARAWIDLYGTTMRIAIAEQFQYRAANYFYMIGMIAEPVVYLVVWTTVANQQGGSVEGITSGEFAAYYIVWTLVRNGVRVDAECRSHGEWGWELQILRNGEFYAGRRFDLRAQAVAYGEDIRREMEGDGWTLLSLPA